MISTWVSAEGERGHNEKWNRDKSIICIYSASMDRKKVGSKKKQKWVSRTPLLGPELQLEAQNQEWPFMIHESPQNSLDKSLDTSHNTTRNSHGGNWGKTDWVCAKAMQLRIKSKIYAVLLVLTQSAAPAHLEAPASCQRSVEIKEVPAKR